MQRKIGSRPWVGRGRKKVYNLPAVKFCPKGGLLMAQVEVRRFLIYTLIVSSLVMLFVYFCDTLLVQSLPMMIRVVSLTQGA